MLYPETCKFEPPRSRIVHECNQSSLKTNMQFAHKITVFLPHINYKYTDLNLHTISDKTAYYKILDVSLIDLLDKQFCEKFLNSGTLSALSIGTRIDCDNCLCITQTGNAVLSLDKGTYEMLGVDGNTIEKDFRYHVNIDLKNASKNYRKKIIKNLEQMKLSFNIILIWEPTDESICSSSIAKYFHDLRYKVTFCTPVITERVLSNIPLPILNELDSMEHFMEWLGLYDQECGPVDDLNTYFKTNQIDELNSISTNEMSSVFSYLSFRGFFTSHLIESFILYLKWALFKYKSSGSWCAVVIQGFSDVPILKNANDPNYFHTCSDNGCILLFCDYSFTYHDRISLNTGKY